MAFISLMEIIDIIIITIVVGYIFSDFFRKPYHEGYELIDTKKVKWENIKFAIMIAAPAVILHEFGHKFVAMGFGSEAVFHAAYLWLAIGIILKLMGAGLIFFVPAYVAHSAAALPWQSALIAFAGPFVNLVLWIGSWIILKNAKKLTYNREIALHLTKKINMFLFIFNMIPLGFFDGAYVLDGLIKTFM